jgi:hypothetical protein
MPSVWEMLGETLAETALGPLVVGGAIVSIVAVPEVRRRVRRWGVRGVAAALAAADLASRQARVTGGDTQGVVGQIGRRVRQAAEEIREEWEDFVAEVQAAREHRTAGVEEPHAPEGAGEEEDAGEAAGEHGPDGSAGGQHEPGGSAAPRGRVPGPRPHGPERSESA